MSKFDSVFGTNDFSRRGSLCASPCLNNIFTHEESCSGMILKRLDVVKNRQVTVNVEVNLRSLDTGLL